jgi:transcriptional regulator with XRE-family HTH domain
METALKRKLDTIIEKGGIKQREVAQLLSTSPHTVSRWQTGDASPQPRKLERLLTLEWVVDQLSQFYQPSEAKLWLFSHHPSLKGARPADLISEGHTAEVLRVIDQLQSSAYV